jgi:hypothetical protein
MANDEFILGRCKSGFEKFLPKKVILIGAGAIHESWKPLQDTFLHAREISKINKDIYESDSCNNQMAGYLAQLVFHFHSVAMGKLKLADDTTLAPARKGAIDAEIEKILANYHSFVSAVGDSFSRQVLILRDEIEYVKQNMDDETGVVVLNWDETIWNLRDIFPNIIQVHGRTSFPETMIFPAEICLEKIHFSKILGGTHFQNDNLLALESAHRFSYEWFSSAREIISWGVGYNLYESELNIILESAFYRERGDGALDRVININPDRSTRLSISRLMNFPVEKIQHYFDHKT